MQIISHPTTKFNLLSGDCTENNQLDIAEVKKRRTFDGYKGSSAHRPFSWADWGDGRHEGEETLTPTRVEGGDASVGEFLQYIWVYLNISHFKL